MKERRALRQTPGKLDFAAEPLFFGRKQILDLFYEFPKTIGVLFIGNFSPEFVPALASFFHSRTFGIRL